jgi:enoyl-CoA hydratase/carnithine racemase
VGLVLSSIDDEGIATLTLNDEANLNAMSDEMAAEFAAAVKGLRDNKSVRVVILTGAGKAFSAGGHLAMLESKRAKSAEENRAGMLAFYASFLGIIDLNVPLIAAINGAAVGAGLCVACACDIRVASKEAKLGFTFLKLGLHPGMGATFWVPRIIGITAATELLLTGRIINAEDSLRLGLVSQLCDAESVVERARAVAREVLACGPEASAQLLATMRRDLSALQPALIREAECQSINYAGSEFAEGLAAIREKRAPKY